MFRTVSSVFLTIVVLASVAQAQSECGPNGCKISRPQILRQNFVSNNDFNLNPGEILLSVDGVPINNSPKFPIVNSVLNVPRNAFSRLIVNRDDRAYQHALREAQIIASRGERYHRSSDGGHPLGVAPGCRFAGTGYSRDPNRPNHCYYGEISEDRLIARAMVPGPNGTYFWSAHYR